MVPGKKASALYKGFHWSSVLLSFLTKCRGGKGVLFPHMVY